MKIVSQKSVDTLTGAIAVLGVIAVVTGIAMFVMLWSEPEPRAPQLYPFVLTDEQVCSLCLHAQKQHSDIGCNECAQSPDAWTYVDIQWDEDGMIVTQMVPAWW